MSIFGIDHVNIAVPSAQLETVVHFYTTIVGMTDGPRPAFPFPGHWLYLDGVERAVIHLATYAEDTLALAQPTGRFNHVCFNLRGLTACRERLQAHGVSFKEQNRDILTVVQLFMQDPAGLGVELSFNKAAEGLTTG